MADAPGKLSGRRLDELLDKEGADADLLALLDLLERSGAGAAKAETEVEVTFRPQTSLGFAGSEVVELAAEPEAGVGVTTAFFGLAGATTPLPLHYAEEFDVDDEFGGTARAVVGLVHDHLTRLLVGAVRSIEPARARSAAETESWLALARTWLSLGSGSRDLPDALLSRLAPMIATGLRTRQMLQQALGVAVEKFLGEASLQVQPWAGTWTAIPDRQILRLSTATACIGKEAILGGRCVHLEGKARICVGPLTTAQLAPFTRDGAAFRRITALLSDVFPEPLQWDLSLEVRVAPEERCRLGERRLSEDLWLESDASARSSTVQVLIPITSNGT